MLGTQVVVRLTNAQKAKLEEIARRTGRTRSQVIRLLVEKAVYIGEHDVRLGEVKDVKRTG